ncbi:MAG: response regulator [Spirochaetales bacterium]|nr:response regulator [Spirochaetales bacterium]
MKILIVDDSEATRKSLKFSLTMRKFEVIDASNVNEAISYLSSNDDICLVITDMNMPGMNGMDLIRFIREKLNLKALPIIVLTTAEDKGKDALTRGASAVVMKSSKASEEIVSFLSRYVV